MKKSSAVNVKVQALSVQAIPALAMTGAMVMAMKAVMVQDIAYVLISGVMMASRPVKTAKEVAFSMV